MTNDLAREPAEKPLNPRQRVFARELGTALAGGSRDFTAAYAAAGYRPDRGNAARLAADPRVKRIADEACEEAARLNGLHIGYLQAKAMELLDASVTGLHRKISQMFEIVEDDDGKPLLVRLKDLPPDQETALDRATWPLSELKIDKDGIITIKLPDKKAIIEMLAKQIGVGLDKAGDVNVGLTLEQLITQAASLREKQVA